MIRVAFVSKFITSLTNFNHDNIVIEYYNNTSVIEYDKYHVVILLVDNNKQNIVDLVAKIRKEYDKILYIIDKSYDNKQLKDIFKLGITDYLNYPINIDYLTQKILSDYNSTNKYTNNNNFEYKNMLIDYEKKYLRINNKFVKLTRVEFLIIAILTQNYERPVSKKEISISIWNCDLDDYRTIETHIKNLRKKIGEYSDNLITVWGFGYAFITAK